MCDTPDGGLGAGSLCSARASLSHLLLWYRSSSARFDYFALALQWPGTICSSTSHFDPSKACATHLMVVWPLVAYVWHGPRSRICCCGIEEAAQGSTTSGWPCSGRAPSAPPPATAAPSTPAAGWSHSRRSRSMWNYSLVWLIFSSWNRRTVARLL